LSLVRVLVNAGYSVSVCCFYESALDMIKSMELAGAKVHLLGLRWDDGLLTLLKNVVTFLRREKPDVVHVQYMAPSFIAVLAARLAGVRTVFATVHQPGRTYGWKAKVLLRMAAAMCTSFFCISRSVEESWFGTSQLFDPAKKQKHCTIYNAVDVERIQQLVEEGREKNLRETLNFTDTPVIGCVGRLRWEKGQVILIEAMPKVLERFPNARLLLIGDGPDRKKLESRASALGLADSIVWLGSVTHDDAMRYMSSMDVLVVPSLFEGFGLVAAEGMAAELPVVGSNVDGLAEVIEDNVTGYLVPPEDSELLAQAIIRLLSSPEMIKCYGRSGYDRISQYYSYRHYVESTTAAYGRYEEKQR